MRSILAVSLLFVASDRARAYVEVPHTLGRVCSESTHIVLMEVTKVNKEKNLVIYKKVTDLKGKHPKDEIKHNIGNRGFHPREWQNIMQWAEPGKRAVFFHNGGASETCIGGYWYQCYPEGPEWWGMSHAEPFLLKTYVGDCDKLAAAVKDILAGKEVLVPCFADQNREDFHLKKGKLQTLKASLKRIDYNAKRDFVGWGGDADIQEFKILPLLAESGQGWRFLPEARLNDKSLRWTQLDFDDKTWFSGKAPLGYGEEEIAKRKGTVINEKGKNILFRKTFNVTPELLNVKGALIRLSVASDDNAIVWLNGREVDRDPTPDHEFAYWNREVDLSSGLFKAGPNVVAVQVKNGPSSSDLFFDLDISVMVPLPKKKVEKK